MRVIDSGLNVTRSQVAVILETTALLLLLFGQEYATCHAGGFRSSLRVLAVNHCVETPGHAMHSEILGAATIVRCSGRSYGA